MPVADPETDHELWHWPPGPMKNKPPQKTNLSLVFVHTTKLLLIATEITNTMCVGVGSGVDLGVSNSALLSWN